jgi:hypothetical protein
MKEFRKTKDNLFICEECSRIFKTYQGLRSHIRHSHKDLTQKNYYDKWLKNSDDGKCKVCGNETEFETLIHGYKFCCSHKCVNIYRSERIIEGVKKKYGVENNFQREECKEKSKRTMKEKYNVEYASQSNIIQQRMKQSRFEKYNDENYNNSDKRKKTCLERYGVISILAHKETMKKAIEKKYGVENVMHNKNIFTKQQISGFKAKKFRDTDLYYRGSYELDFLEKFYDKIDIENGPSINYLFEGENHIYHSDFYIPSKNLIIEIKSLYYYEKYKDKCIAKERASLDLGYNYKFIIDKDYSDLTS